MDACKCIIISLLLTIAGSGMVRAAEDDYKVDDEGNIVVSKVVEGINAGKADIYAAALKYIKNAYKVTKYQITTENEKVGTIIGKGNLLNYYSKTIFPSTYYISSDIFLRIDAKEGRVRISVYAQEYGGQRQNANITEELHVRISDAPPVGDKVIEESSLYVKAFPLLLEQMEKILAEVEETLSKMVSVAVEDW